MKRILCALAALTLFFTLLTACGGPKTALSIGGAQLNSEIYTYYYDLAVRSPEEYPGDARENAIQLCKEYVAVNTVAAEQAVRLGTEQETSASSWVNQQWKFFSGYYNRLGISKQTLMKVRENEERKALLLEAYYGAGGSQPVSEEELKAYFSSHFVVFYSIDGYLTDINDAGEQVALSEARVNEITQQFNDMAKNIQDGASIAQVNDDYLKAQNSSGMGEFTASVIDGDNTAYPEGFYDQVAAMKANEVKVITLGSYIYVVQKLNPLMEDGVYFTQYQQDVLNSMKGGELAALLQAREDTFEVTQKNSVLKRCEKLVEQEHAENEGETQSTSGDSTSTEPQQTAASTTA